MKRQSRRTLCAAGLITAALASGAFAQQQEEKLGTLSFPTSCDPRVQAEFERGVAMIHSYWFLVARRVFEGVLQQDPVLAEADMRAKKARSWFDPSATLAVHCGNAFDAGL